MIKAYHRVETIEDALRLAGRAGVKTALLPGYDALVDEMVDEVVDLQLVPLKGISVSGATATLEGLVMLQTLADHDGLPDWLRGLAREEAPSTLRNMQTVASVMMAASPESLLLAALLVADTEVMVQNAAGVTRAFLFDALVGNAAGFPTSLKLALDGVVAVAKVGRTPADKPIVAAVARRGAEGGVRLALCGVAATPILVSPDALESLAPIGDFRGSAAYRKQMAGVLSQRVLAQV
jgi:CO/xanthine dehydrogenase FAD-binding subunit